MAQRQQLQKMGITGQLLFNIDVRVNMDLGTLLRRQKRLE